MGTAIQTDAPGAFTVQIDVYNGETLLGSLSEDSDASGNALFIGVIDQDGPNITKLIVSVPRCVGDCTDFALGTLYLNTSVQPQAATELYAEDAMYQPDHRQHSRGQPNMEQATFKS